MLQKPLTIHKLSKFFFDLNKKISYIYKKFYKKRTTSSILMKQEITMRNFKKFFTFIFIAIFSFTYSILAQSDSDTKNLAKAIISTSQGGTYSSSWSTGLSSGDGEDEEDARLELFIASNFDQLEQEVAQGKGERLETLAYLYGCPKQSNHTFELTIQNNYNKLYLEKNNDKIDFSQKIRKHLSSNEELVSSCKKI